MWCKNKFPTSTIGLHKKLIHRHTHIHTSKRISKTFILSDTIKWLWQALSWMTRIFRTYCILLCKKCVNYKQIEFLYGSWMWKARSFLFIYKTQEKCKYIYIWIRTVIILDVHFFTVTLNKAWINHADLAMTIDECY